MASFHVAYDPANWVLLPKQFPTDEDSSAAEWAGRQAQERRARQIDEPASLESLNEYFIKVLAVADELTVDYDAVFLFLPEQAPGFLLIGCELGEASGPITETVDAVCVRRGNEYEQPTVTPIEFLNIGQGVRVVRRDFDERREVYASIGYYFQFGGLYFLLTTQSYSLPAVDFVMSAIDELLAGVTISMEPA